MLFALAVFAFAPSPNAPTLRLRTTAAPNIRAVANPLDAVASRKPLGPRIPSLSMLASPAEASVRVLAGTALRKFDAPNAPAGSSGSILYASLAPN